MHEITALEIGLLVRELKGSVEFSRIRKFYDLGSGAFKIAFYKNGETHLVYIKLLRTINITSFSEPADEATQFAMAVRKRIENSVVDTIEQENHDRIIKFNLDKGKRTIILEMYGKGNMFLIDSEGTIEACYRTNIHAAHQIKVGTKYEYPKSSSEDPLAIDRKAAERIASGIGTGKSLIAETAKILNVGPMYLEDIITRAGLDPRAASISEKQRQNIAEQILVFGRRIATETPRIYYNSDGAAADFAACSIAKYESMKSKNFATMSSLLDELYLHERSSVPDTAKEGRLKELKLNIEKQEQLLSQLSADTAEYAKYGKRILEKMNIINALCAYLKENKRATLDDVKSEFPELEVKELDLKNKTVKITLQQ